MSDLGQAPAGIADSKPRSGLLRDRRFLLIAALTLAIAGYFWLQSRYPALDAKAAMGGQTPVAGLAFDVVVEVLPDSGVLWDMAANTLNWVYTNWKGMAFGILFGACMLTLFGLFTRRSFDRPFADAALGAALGAPLGVCVNCAAPIAQGLHSAGTRLETTLGALIASPTLNIIVVSMSFALLPTYMAALKLAAMLGFILLGIPLMTRFVFRRERAESGPAARERLVSGERGWLARTMEHRQPDAASSAAADSWPGAVWWLARTFSRNLAFIVAVTVPLMLLAGILGAVTITALPFDRVQDLLGAPQGLGLTTLSVLALAAFAILLPVPMAFDVVLAVILVNSGWPAVFVIPLLLGLGSFSVYSLLVIGRAVSFRVAGTVMAGLALLAAAAAPLGWWLDDAAQRAAYQTNLALLDAARPLATPRPESDPGLPFDRLGLELAAGAVAHQPFARPVTHQGSGRVSLAYAPLTDSEAVGRAPFTRLMGDTIGIDLPPFLSGIEALEPFTYFWGVAAADIHGDGWIDLALARGVTRGGIVLYANRQGRFVRQQLDLGVVGRGFVNALAFVDLDNDTRPDLFVSTHLAGAHVFWNRGGRFAADARTALPNGDAVMIGAPAFADLDGDGRLDILAANWSLGIAGNMRDPHLERSRDRILWNEGGRFTAQDLSGLPGDSLTSLLTDLNDDGLPDIMIGDDLSSADKVYLNQGDRRFRLIGKSDGLIPWLTTFTMSFDAGDIDNDLAAELYGAQIATSGPPTVISFEPGTTYCKDRVAIAEAKGTCFADIRDRQLVWRHSHPSLSKCDSIADPRYRALCAARSLIMRSADQGDPDTCAAMPAHWPRLRRICEIAATKRVRDWQTLMKAHDYVGAVMDRNLFLQREAGGGFVDRTAEFGVEKPGWSWNAKFADLDQDGWQDLYVATGVLTDREPSKNAYYRNIDGTRFESAAAAFGLADEIPTSSYVLLDYDRDGDVDMIRPSVVSQPIVHRNDRPAGRALWVRLVDEIGNSAGVGASVVVRTGGDAGWRQIREIRQSGGFVSFDPPQAHFGLGPSRQVDEVVVTWRDGAVTRIAGPIPADAELVVRRHAD